MEQESRSLRPTRSGAAGRRRARRLIAALLTGVAAFAGVNAPPPAEAATTPAACSIEDCKQPAADPLAAMPYDAALDDDMFVLFTSAEEICAQAIDMADDGIPVDDIVDEGVDILAVDPDTRIVTTTEAIFYLRGMLVGCLASA